MIRMIITDIFSFQKKYFLNLFVGFIVLLSLSFYSNAQECSFGIMDEVDFVVDTTITQNSFWESDTEFVGEDFVTGIEVNIPVCGEIEGCIQFSLVSDPSEMGYSYPDIGFSSAAFYVFSDSIWNNQIGAGGFPISEDGDAFPGSDGFVLEAAEQLFSLSSYNIPIEGQSATFIVVVHYKCASAPAIVCQEEIIEFSFAWPSEMDGLILSSTDVSCYGEDDGTIVASSITGGTPDYTYDWYIDSASGSDIDGDGDLEELYATTPDTVLNSAIAGVYTLVVTDSEGCILVVPEINTVISEPDPLDIVELISDVSCNGDGDGEINITVTGGTPDYTYLWSNGEITEDITDLVAGEYTVTVTDDSLCVLTESFIVTEPDPLELTVEDITGVLCPGGSDGSINITVTGGTPDGGPYTYAWSNGETAEDPSGLSAGIYTVTVFDENGCSETSGPLEVFEPEPLTTIDEIVTNVSCNGGSDGAIDLEFAGGTPDGGPYNYSWLPNGETTQDLENVPAGIYFVTVLDDFECIYTDTVLVTEPDPLVLTHSHIDVACNGGSSGSIDLAVTGGTPDGGPYTYSWSNGATTEDISDLEIGTYTVTVTDDNLCAESLTVVIVEPDSLELSVLITDVSCAGLLDGEIDLEVAGGSPDGGPYTYSWDNGETTEDITGLETGLYTVTVTDDSLCVAVETYFVPEPDSLLVDIVVTDVLCAGGSDGAIELEVSGGSGVYTYGWSTGAISEDISSLTAGLYTFTINDGSCSQTDTIQVFEPDSLSLNPIVFDISCNGLDDGIIDLSVTGGIPFGDGTYTYEWSNGATTEDLNNLSAGTYSVTVTDANGCIVEGDFIINDPDSLEISIESATDFLLCFGDTIGSIDIAVSGGTLDSGSYTYSWSNGETTEDIIGLTSGTYTVIVTDDNDCSDTLVYEIESPDPFVFTELITDVSCNGFSDGAIDLEVTGGTPDGGPYTYSWSNGETTEDIGGLSPGVYTVVVTDVNLCVDSASYIIDELNPLDISLDYAPDSLACFGDTIGSIEITVSGGTGIGTYTYLWDTDDASTSEDLIGVLSAGTYTVIVTDENLCSDSLTVVIPGPDELQLIATVSDASCNGIADGSIDLTVIGGTPDYTFDWSNGATTEDINDLGPGTYTVIVTDENLCSDSLSVPVEEPDVFELTSVFTSLASCCNVCDGSVEINLTGGTPPYTIIGDTTNLCIGLDTVQVVDFAGCILDVPFEIETDYCIDFTLAAEAECPPNLTIIGLDGLTAYGGEEPYTYEWLDPDGNQITIGTDVDGDGAEAQILVGEAGIYTVIVTDSGGACETSATYEYAYEYIELDYAVVDTACFNECNATVNIIPSDNFPAGWRVFYSSNDLDGNGIANIDSDGDPVDNDIDGDGIDNDLDDDIDGDGVDTDGDGVCDINCNDIPSIIGDTDTYPTASAYSDYIELFPTFIEINDCDTDFLTPNGSGELDCCDIDGDGIPNNEDPDMDGDGIPNIAAFLELDIDGDGIPNDGLDGIPGNEDDDPNPNGDVCFVYVVEDLCPGEYYAIAADDIDAVGVSPETIICESFLLFFDVPSYDEILTNATLSECPSGDQICCNGDLTGSIDLEVTGGAGNYTYSWNTGAVTEDLFNIGAGTYYVDILDQAGCFASDTFELTEPPLLDFTAEFDTLLCYSDCDAFIDIEVFGGSPPYTYGEWSGTLYDGTLFTSSDTSLTDLCAGDYTMQVTDTNNCEVIIQVEIIQPPDLIVSLDNATDILPCLGDELGSIDISVNGGTPNYTYEWSNGATTEDINGLGAGEYTVIVTDENECVDSLTHVIDAPEELVVFIDDATDLLDCFGDSDGFIDIEVTGGTPFPDGSYTYFWSNGATSEDINGLGAGTYFVTIIDANDCEETLIHTVFEPAEIVITLEDSFLELLCFGDDDGYIDVSVSGGTPFDDGSYLYSWSNGADSEDINGLIADTYTLTVTDANDCTQTATYVVTEPAQLVINVVAADTTLCFGENNGFININVTGGTPNYTYSWSNGATSEDINGLSIGTYSLTVTDDNGCFVTDSYTIIESSDIVITLEEDSSFLDLICFGDSNGNIDVSVTGGTPFDDGSYIYSWSNGSGSEDINNLVAGTYTLTVTDSEDCTQTATYVVTEPDEIIITLEEDASFLELLCFGDDNGNIDVSITGGTPFGDGSYTLSWSNGSITEDINGLVAGTYTLTVTDANNCTQTATYVVTEPSLLQCDGVIIPISCDGDDDGQIDLTVVGGTPFGDGSYTYSWSNGSISEDISSLTPGTYLVTVTDANGCECSNSFDVVAPNNDVEISIDNVEDSSCWSLDCNDASIDVTVTGGSGFFQYTWTGSNGFSQISFLFDDVSNISAGTYFLDVLDIVDGCEYSAGPIVITEPTPIELYDDIDGDGSINSPASEIIFTDYVCGDACDGQIDLTSIDGGTPSYEFELLNDVGEIIGESTSGILSGLCAGCYTVNIYDSNWYDCPADPNACFAQFDFCIEASDMTIVSEILPSGCNPTGFSDFTFVNGLPPYNINLTDGSGDVVPPLTDYMLDTIAFSNLEPGSYELMVVDSIGCPYYYNFDIIDFVNELEILSISAVQPWCPDELGSFTVEFSNALNSDSLPFSGFITLVENNNDDCIFDSSASVIVTQEIPLTTDSIISVTVDNLAGGEYNFIIEDYLECSVDSCFSITYIPPFTPEIYFISSDPVTCFEESGSANVSWDPLDVGGTPIIDTTFVVDFSAINSYVVDTLGLDSLELDSLVFLLEFNPQDDVYSITFECDDEVFTDIIEDSNDNDLIDSDDILSFVSGAEDFCNGILIGLGDILSDYLSVSGPDLSEPYYIVQWTDSDGNPVPTVTPDALVATALSAGDYQVVVIDANLCSDTVDFTINQPPNGVVTGVDSSMPEITCCYTGIEDCDGELQIAPTGGVGDYYIVEVDYSNPDLPAIPSETFVLQPGINPDTVLLNLCPGEWTVTVHDSDPFTLDLCPPDIYTLEITQPECLDWTIETQPLFCYGDILDWDLEGNSVNNNSDVVDAVLYWFDPDGDLPDATQDEFLNDLDNALDPNTLVAGFYDIYSVVDGCLDLVQEGYEIEGPDQLYSDVNIYESDTLIYCYGDTIGSIFINTYYAILSSTDTVFYPANDPITYLWYFNDPDNSDDLVYLPEYDNQNFVENLPAGTYEIIVNNQYDCGPISHTVIIEEPDPLNVSLNIGESFTSLDCNGDNDGLIVLNVEGGLLSDVGYIFNWSGIDSDGNAINLFGQENNQNLENLPAGQYTCQVFSNIPSFGSSTYPELFPTCEDQIIVSISEPDELFAFAEPIHPLCNGDLGGVDLTVIGGTPPYTYEWSNGEITADLDGVGPGLYLVTITDNNNCTPVFASVEIIEPTVFEIPSGQLIDGITIIPSNCGANNGDEFSSASGSIEIYQEDFFSQFNGGTMDYQWPPYLVYNPSPGAPVTCLNGLEMDGQEIGADVIIFDNLPGGNYILCAMDANGCMVSDDIVVGIVEGNEIIVDVCTEPATCDGNGSIFISSILNGSSPYYITIENEDGSIVLSSDDDGLGNQWFEVDLLADDDSDGIPNGEDPDFNMIESINCPFNSLFSSFTDWNNNGLDDVSYDIDGDGLINAEDPDIDGDGVDEDGDGTCDLNCNSDDPFPYNSNNNGNFSESDSIFDINYFGWYNQIPAGNYQITIIDSQGCTGSVFEFVVDLDVPEFPIESINGDCYYNTNNYQSCDDLINNGSIIIDPNTTDFISTLYPYQIFVDDTVFVINNEDDWDLDGDGVDQYVIPNLEAGTAYSLLMIDGNGCGYSNNGEYYEIGFNSYLDVDIVGFCPECQESNNGGFAYILSPIEDEAASGLNPDWVLTEQGPAMNSELDIIYTNNNYDLPACLGDIDGDGINNTEDLDIDGDGVLNNEDDDMDGDGIPNTEDDDINYNYNFTNIVQIQGELSDGFQSIEYIDEYWWNNTMSNEYFVGDQEKLEGYYQDYLMQLYDTTTNIVSGLSYGTYEITIIDHQNGCQFTEEIDISNETCEEQFGEEQWENCLFIPSVFTPNSDEFNDQWEIYNIDLYNPTGVKLTVFNRWGQIVYQNTEKSFGVYNEGNFWDGIDQNTGKPVEIATYYYVLELNRYDGKAHTGYVVVKR
ncbi:MAG: hypothetical protein CMP62_01910 [Flavobacteriales bacterium]|nr:hypothetical protein [Flavobacteriales bacterium]